MKGAPTRLTPAGDHRACDAFPSYAHPQKRAARRNRHCIEVEASQAELRKSIEATERLVSESDEMLRRHRKECEDAAASGDE